MRKRFCCSLAFSLLALAPVVVHDAARSQRNPVAPTGPVAEVAEKGGAAERAGLMPGDVLLSWERAAAPPANPLPARGRFLSPFDLSEAEIEEAPRGGLTLHGMRAGGAVSWTLSPGDWKLQARPEMASEVLEDYGASKTLLAAGELEAGARGLRRLAEKANAQSDYLLAAWLGLTEADVMWKLGKPDGATAAYGRAADCAEKAGRPLAQSQIWEAMGLALQKRNQPAGSEEPHKKALDLRRRCVGESLSVARSLYCLGGAAYSRGDLTLAEKYDRESLAIQEKLAPESLAVAASLNGLGLAARGRGDLDLAETLYKRSLACREKLAPESLDAAWTLSNLGVVAKERGDLALAEKYYQASLALRQRLAPGSPDVAAALNNLGTLAYSRGDLTRAEASYRESLRILEGVAPQSLLAAASWNNLGLVFEKRGDYTLAQEYYGQSLAIVGKLAPGSLYVAGNLNNLGQVAQERGDNDLAEKHFKASLDVREKLAPGSLDVAESWNNLGEIASRRGDLARAQECFRECLTIQEKLAPGSLDTAITLRNLGDVAGGGGDAVLAERLYTRSAGICEKLAPGSAQEAESLGSLGGLYKRRKDPSRAETFFLRAVDALESQKGKIGGGSEAAEHFSSRYSDLYRDLVEVQVGLGKTADAFSTLERFRAQELLRMLTERDLDFSKDVPEELLKSKKLADHEYDRIQEKLALLSPENDAGEVESLLFKLADLKRTQRETAEAIKKASPRLASLVYERPLDLPGATKILDERVLLLSYCVGEDESYLFALLDGALNVYPIPEGRSRLGLEIRRYRRFLSDPTVPRGVLDRSAARLFELLLAPARKQIAGAGRLILCPDGPLHALPFAALRTAHGRYLGVEKSLAWTLSATVLSEVAGRPRSAPSSVQLAAFGDPASAPSQASANESWRTLSPLPATAKEVRSIGGLFPGSAELFLGKESTEESARRSTPGARYIHFACHGYLDARFPLDYGLVLAPPDSKSGSVENGILQAWEVMESLRLDAELVALSACQTGSGKEMGGEGVIGLTRAFQYAGARSVLSSLWSVSDESTAELMRRFYGYLKAGKPKAEALRLAQVEMIRTGRKKGDRDFSHPFYWAAFELHGRGD